MPEKAASPEISPKGSLWTVPAMIVGLSMFLIAIVISFLAGLKGVSLAELVRDPAATYKYPPYVGFFSHIGIVLMVSTAALTGFAAWISRSLGLGQATVLAATSALSLLLAIDDIFMLHEQASRLGEALLFAIYGILGLAIWFKLRLHSDQFDLRGFKVAIFFLGLSVFTDLFKIYGPFAHWLEDFSKLSGFGAWLTFWAGFAGRSLITEGQKLRMNV